MPTSINVNINLQLTRKGNPFLTEEQMLTWISECLNCNKNHVEAVVTIAEAPTAIVEMDGGLIQQIIASGPMHVVVLDADIEGADEDEVSTIDNKEVVVINHGAIGIYAEDVHSVIAQIKSAAT